jgi:hypothetical protein
MIVGLAALALVQIGLVVSSVMHEKPQPAPVTAK